MRIMARYLVPRPLFPSAIRMSPWGRVTYFVMLATAAYGRTSTAVVISRLLGSGLWLLWALSGI